MAPRRSGKSGRTIRAAHRPISVKTRQLATAVMPSDDDVPAFRKRRDGMVHDLIAEPVEAAHDGAKFEIVLNVNPSMDGTGMVAMWSTLQTSSHDKLSSVCTDHILHS